MAKIRKNQRSSIRRRSNKSGGAEGVIAGEIGRLRSELIEIKNILKVVTMGFNQKESEDYKSLLEHAKEYKQKVEEAKRTGSDARWLTEEADEWIHKLSANVEDNMEIFLQVGLD